MTTASRPFTVDGVFGFGAAAGAAAFTATGVPFPLEPLETADEPVLLPLAEEPAEAEAASLLSLEEMTLELPLDADAWEALEAVSFPAGAAPPDLDATTVFVSLPVSALSA